MPNERITVTMTCAYCGQTKDRTTVHRTQVPKYCGEPCRIASLSQKFSRSCNHCGTAYLAQASFVERGKGLYCQRICYTRALVAQRASRPVPPRKRAPRRSPHGSLSQRLWGQVDKTDWCWLGMGRGGRHWKLHRGDNLGKVFAHVAAWEEANGVHVPEGRMICHTCDVGACVRNDDVGIYVVEGVEYPRVGHLWLGDDASNMADKVAKGRQSVGEQTGKARLTPDLVRAIRVRLAQGATRQAVADEFQIGMTTLFKVATGVTWKYVT